jgi:hypothetical protein
MVDQNPLLALNLDDAPVVARASSQRPKSTNWTALTIYGALHLGMPGVLYIAEIVGGTTKAGEETRVKRAGFPTLAKALNWNAFDPATSLFDDLRRTVIDGLESGAHLPSLFVLGPAPDELKVAVQHGPGGPITSFQAVPWIMKPPVLRHGFDGKGGLLGGIMWLYEGILPEGDDQAAVDAFAADFGIDRRDVGAAVFACGVGYKQTDLNGWTAFVAGLRFFDREAFQANRAAG